MVTTKKKWGNKGEQIVADMLERKGFLILKRNYQKPFGEIDLIATNKELLLFVEVKLRRARNIDLAELVGFSKQSRIGSAARAYLSESKDCEKVYRFDVALVDMTQGSPDVAYIADAFQINEGY